MRLVLKDFTGGINRATDPTKIGENEFYTFQNLIIYKLGSLGNAVKRAGLEVWNTRSLADADTNQQIFQYISNSKSSNFSRFIVKSTTQTKYITSAGDSSYTVIIGTTPVPDVTGKVRFLVFRDNLYILNRNTSGTYQSNKFYNGTDCVDMGLPPCPNTFKIQSNTATTVKTEAGVYYYLMTFVYDDGQESAPLLPTSFDPTYTGSPDASIGDASTTMWLFSQGTTRLVGGVAGANKLLTLINIPTGNARVTKRRIYRTKDATSGMGAFYFLADINDNTTTTFVDNKLSSDLFEPYDIQAIFKPPIAKFGVFHKDRMFIANLKENQWTEKPVATGASLSSSGTGGFIEPGVYKYKFAYIYDIPTLTGTPTVSARPIQGFYGDVSSAYKEITVPTDTSTNSVSITTIDNSNDYSKRVVIYRTKAGGSTYYPIGVTALGGTTFTDTWADGELDESVNLFEAMGLEKITTDKTLPSTLQWSDVNHGDSFPPDNSIEVEANDNDVITGLISEDDGILIFKERNIYKLFTDREQTYWLLRKVVSNKGCTEPYSIVTIGTNTHLFNSNGQIYLYSNGQAKRISDKIQPILDGFGTVSNIDVCFDSFRNWVVWTYQYTDNTVVVQDMLVLDLNFPQNDNIGSWYHFRHYSIGGDTPINDGLTICSPLSAKDGSLLFGSTSNCLMQYGKTPQYKDTYHVSGTATDRIIDVKLLKYFDFDEWEIERFLGKFRLGGASSTTVSSSGKTTTKTTSGADTKVRVNTRVNSGKVQEEYIQVAMPSHVSFEIKEVGFDYIPKHEKRGSF